mgnify:CR=1 FL=1
MIETPGARAAAARAAIAAAFPAEGPAAASPQAPAAAAAAALAGDLHLHEAAEGDEDINGLLRFVSGDTVLSGGALASGDFR